eukprot:316612-Chlamydomonas_euryale.AAC.1
MFLSSSTLILSWALLHCLAPGLPVPIHVYPHPASQSGVGFSVCPPAPPYSELKMHMRNGRRRRSVACSWRKPARSWWA